MMFRRLIHIRKQWSIGSMLAIIFILAPVVGFAQDAADANAGADTNTEDTNNAVDAEKPVPKDYAEPLIDFTEIAQGIPELSKNFGSTFITSLTEKDIDELNINYDLKNWEVVLRSSIRTPYTIEHTGVKKVLVAGGDYKGESVLGIRTRFPDAPFEMDIEVIPPFPVDPGMTIKTPQGEEKLIFQGKGLIDNVGVVRSAYLTIYGLNQNERVYVITTDPDGNEYEYSFGSLDFLGWKTLDWNNPAYIEDIASVSVKNLPVYPQKTSMRIFKAIKYVHSSQNNNPDFVSYVRDIKLTYDKAIDPKLLNDIDNESYWRLMNSSVTLRNKILIERTERNMYLRYMERRKKYDYNKEAPTPANEGQ